MRESTLEKAIVKYARSRGCLTYKFVSPQNRGVPDRIFIGPTGTVLFMEIKAPGKKPTALQSRTIHEIMGHLGNAVWVDNLEKAVSCIDYFCILEEFKPDV